MNNQERLAKIRELAEKVDKSGYGGAWLAGRMLVILNAPAAQGEAEHRWLDKEKRCSCGWKCVELTIMNCRDQWSEHKARCWEQVEAPPAFPPPQDAKGSSEPWLYAIAEPNGNWQDGESCVFQDLISCQDAVDCYNDNLNEDEPQYAVVPLYSTPAESTRNLERVKAQVRLDEARIWDEQYGDCESDPNDLENWNYKRIAELEKQAKGGGE